MLPESLDEENIIGRVAALDIGKSELVCCARVPATEGRTRRLQEVSTHSTMPRALSELSNCGSSGWWWGDIDVLEAGVLRVGGARAGSVAGQRPRGQERAGPGQDGLVDRTTAGILGRMRAGRGLVG
jgi:hypothetical protein